MNNWLENEEEEKRKEGEQRREEGKGAEDDGQTGSRLKVDHQRNSGISTPPEVLAEVPQPLNGNETSARED